MLRAIALACVPAAAAVIFVIGIGWGLPRRTVDPYLFGHRPVWTGAKIAALAPSDAGGQGADVDVNPITDRSGITILNQTDSQRAEIIRRYRLYSDQPDEMITFRSLSMLRQHHGDPRLYQYGGMWIYPVGAIVRAGMAVGLIQTPRDAGAMTKTGGQQITSHAQRSTFNAQLATSNPQPTTSNSFPSPIDPQAFYIDHPEAFGRFYVLARLYSAAWGVVAVLAMYWIVRRLSGGRILAAMGAVCFALLPVVVTMSHEAKPHLPGLALTLLAAIAASKYVATRRMRWALLAGGLCGAAMGMVISALLAFAMLPVMALLGRDEGGESGAGQRGTENEWGRRVGVLALSVAIGVIVYCVTNPFVPINAIWHREILRSNLGNSGAMYDVSAGGFANAARLLIEGTSPFVFAAGVGGMIFLILRRIIARRRGARSGVFGACRPSSPTCACPGQGDIGWLLAAPAVLVLIQFFLLASDKPPEYARFALLPDSFLVICAFTALGWVASRPARGILGALVMLAALPFGVRYLAGYVRDSGMNSSRLVAAQRLAEFADEGARTIRVPAEPAPYCMPPVDLFRYTLLLVPPEKHVPADLIVQMDHAHSLYPIGWADVRFDLRPGTAK